MGAGSTQGPDAITAMLNNVIEQLLSDSYEQAELHANLLLDEINRRLGSGRDRIEQARGTDLEKLRRLRDDVRDGRLDIMTGDHALSLKKFKEARERWMELAKGK